MPNRLKNLGMASTSTKQPRFSILSSLIEVFRKHKGPTVLAFVFTIGLVAFVVIIFFVNRIAGSDDTIFKSQTAPYDSVIDWIIQRYNSWRGGLFSEGFIYAFSTSPLVLWKITTVFMYGLFVELLFSCYKLLDKTQDYTKDIAIAIGSFAHYTF